jgi:hypothetical protein
MTANDLPLALASNILEGVGCGFAFRTTVQVVGSPTGKSDSRRSERVWVQAVVHEIDAIRRGQRRTCCCSFGFQPAPRWITARAPIAAIVGVPA